MQQVWVLRIDIRFAPTVTESVPHILPVRFYYQIATVEFSSHVVEYWDRYRDGLEQACYVCVTFKTIDPKTAIVRRILSDIDLDT